MASDSAFHYSSSSSDDEDALNNTQIGPTLMEQQSDDGSIASSGSNDSNEPAAATAPPHSSQALQLKKQQCCDLFIHTFQHGQLYDSPLALQAAIIDVAKQFHFSIRRQGFNFACSRAMRNYTRKATISSAPSRDSKTFKVECPFRISFNYADRKLKHEVTEADKQAGGKTRTSDRVKITSLCAMHGLECQLHINELQTVLKKGGHLSRFETGQMVSIINMVNNRAGKFGSNELREVLKPMFPSDYFVCVCGKWRFL